MLDVYWNPDHSALWEFASPTVDMTTMVWHVSFSNLNTDDLRKSLHLDLKVSLCSLNSGVLETDNAFMCFVKWSSRIKMMNCSFEGGTGFRNGGAVAIFVSSWNHKMTVWWSSASSSFVSTWVNIGPWYTTWFQQVHQICEKDASAGRVQLR